ncbi:MAG TPA: ABC transporter permease, partial [Ktedonobacterales bacterium]|nr:ABC transporter permease [Ktedonobacterales bacterium]
MSLRRVFALALRIVRQFLRDRRSLALVFVAPLLIMTLLNFVLNNSSSSVTLGIVPPSGQAGDAMLSQIRAQLSAASGVSVISVAPDAVDATLRNGDADAVLIFPASLGAYGETLTLRLEGSNPGAAQQIRGVVTQLVTGLYARMIQSGGSTPSVQTPQLSVSYLYGGPEYTA